MTNFFLSLAMFLLTLCINPQEAYATRVDNPLLEIDAVGDAVAVWEERGMDQVVRAATLVVGSSWTAPVTISNISQESQSPALVVNGLGNAVALWVVIDSVLEIRSLYSSMLPKGGSWSTPVLISATNESVVRDESVRMDDSGDIVAIWSSNTNADPNTVLRSASATFGGSWTVPVTISN